MGTRLQQLTGRIGSTSWGTTLLRTMAPFLDRIALRLSKGRHTLTEWQLPVLVLHTTGRRTGQPRENPLAYIEDGDAFVVAGSNWGQQHQPAWSENLLAHPDAEIVVKGERRRARARLATEDERARLWPRLDAVYAGFPAYRKRAGDRQIRLFILEPGTSN